MKTFFSLIILLFLAFTVSAQTVAETNTTVQKQRISQTKVKVFPNPATSVVNVLGLKNTSKADITILDIYGNAVLSHQWEIRRNAINIPVSTLDPGAYIITVSSNEQQVRIKFYKR